MYRNKFLFTKRVINFVKLYSSSNKDGNKDGNRDIIKDIIKDGNKEMNTMVD